MPIDAFAQVYAETDWQQSRANAAQRRPAPAASGSKGIAAGDPVPPKPSPPTPEPVSSYHGKRSSEPPVGAGQAEFTFHDVLTIINPLQQLPLINNLYRDLTGDIPSPHARVMGAILFGGGAFGAVTSMIDNIVVETTGKDIGETILAGVFGDSGPPGGAPASATRVASAIRSHYDPVPTGIEPTAPTMATAALVTSPVAPSSAAPARPTTLPSPSLPTLAPPPTATAGLANQASLSAPGTSAGLAVRNRSALAPGAPNSSAPSAVRGPAPMPQRAVVPVRPLPPSSSALSGLGRPPAPATPPPPNREMISNLMLRNLQKYQERAGENSVLAAGAATRS